MKNQVVIIEVPSEYRYAGGLKFDPKKIYTAALKLFMREYDPERFITKLADEVDDNIRRFQHDVLRLERDDMGGLSIHDEFRMLRDFLLHPVQDCIYGLYEKFGLFDIISISNFGKKFIMLELAIKEIAHESEDPYSGW